MPTQEERLTTLEENTAKHIRQTNEHLTMTLGLIQRQAFDINAINNSLDTIRENIYKTMNVRFDGTNAHLELLQKHADAANAHFTAIETTQAEHAETLKEHTELLKIILTRLPEKP